MTYNKKQCLLFCMALCCALTASAQFARRERTVPTIKVEAKSVIYTTDDRGNRIPDYSYCGYKASEDSIPFVSVKAVVPCHTGDMTREIQTALDYVSSLPIDAQGFRGAVLLEPGQYEVKGALTIKSSGVVLRGSGCLENGTEILAAGDDRTTLIRIAGKKDRKYGPMQALSKDVPTGAMAVCVQNHSFKEGDSVCVMRAGTQEWIDEMDMNNFGGESDYIGWKPKHADGRPGEVDVYWERKITKIVGDSIYLDAPLTCEMRTVYQEGQIASLTFPGRIRQSGVENIRLSSTYHRDNVKDENHRWIAINFDNIEDAWVRRVEFRHFAGSAVFITETGRRITVEDCKSFEPISEIAACRRNAFYTLGGQCLFQRLYAEYGMHDFGTGRCTPGPTAFVQCEAMWSNHFSGTIDSWATGVLFDAFHAEGNALSFANRGQDGMGAGWTAANSMAWNCSASLLACPNPPTAYNWVYGAWGQRAGNAVWVSSSSHVNPRSLYYTQLAARLGRATADAKKIMPFDTQSASNPPIDKAQLFVAEARYPAMELTEWIDSLMAISPIEVDIPQGKNYLLWQKNIPTKEVHKDYPGLLVQQGVIVRNGKMETCTRQGIVWWNGSLKDRYLRNAQSHITRFVPGRTGKGFTDDLDELVKTGVATSHNYALWYDRRRDDHERIRRMDGYVWGPFYELPFARSGEGRAWDGMSKYDLTKWNVWYWNRLKQYADLADERGAILFHQQYFQHNILEAGAHYADFPWRAANNINKVELPEPVPYASDKRVYMAESFYDLERPQLKAMHRNYIRKCLENFADNGSVIQFTSEEYTGPLAFTQFWVDVIAEWEAETGKNVLVALSATKDVQDAILQDSVRSKSVDIIDIKYWRPVDGGGFYAPEGGLSLAPRQFSRLGNRQHVEGNGKGKNMSERVYETVLDYRRQYPDKAVIFSEGCSDPWAAFMAGASLSPMLRAFPEKFLHDVALMQVIEGETWLLGKPKIGYVVYPRDKNITIDLSQDKTTYRAQWLSREGKALGEIFKIKGGDVYKGNTDGSLLWLFK